MRVSRRIRKKRRPKKPAKPMKVQSMIIVGCMGFFACLLLFVLWYYYPYNELQFFVQKTDVDQEHYTKKLVQMQIHPKYEPWMRRHNKNNESLHNLSSINNDYNPFNKDSVSKDEMIEITQLKYSEDEIKHIFSKYLQPLCVHKNILSHDYLSKPLPDDCDDLLHSMINITTHHLLNENEIHALSQRIEYLMDIVPQNGVYLLIHIPHTAMKSIIMCVVKQNFNRKEILHCDDDIAQNRTNVKLVYGHIPYGMDKILISSDEDTEYVLSIDELEKIENGDDEHGKLKDLWINKLNFTYYTMLRDPIDFVVAHYYDADNKDKYKDLDDFIEHKLNRNIMTKYIAGSQEANDEEINVNRNHYISARNNLLSMGWIGLFDKLQASAEQLTYFWQLEHAPYENMKTEFNKNFDKPQEIKLTLTQHQIILKRNKWDVMLYELAVVLYKQQAIVTKYKVLK